jgi:hypothetical protein
MLAIRRDPRLPVRHLPDDWPAVPAQAGVPAAGVGAGGAGPRRWPSRCWTPGRLDG